MSKLKEKVNIDLDKQWNPTQKKREMNHYRQQHNYPKKKTVNKTK